MASLFHKPRNPTQFQRKQLGEAQFGQIKDALRKKKKEKAHAEAIVMEWYAYTHSPFLCINLKIVILAHSSNPTQ